MATRYKDRPPEYERHWVRNASARNGSKVYGIMCHTIEGLSLPGTRNWFNNPASQASSWIGVGRDGASELWVPGAEKAWTMAHYKINAETLNIEFAGFAAQSASAWNETQLKVGAKWAAYAIINYDFVKIDPRNVRRSVLKMGTGEPYFSTPGIGRHKDATNIGIGTHVDPGPAFPMSDFIDLVQYYCDHGWTVST